MRVAVVHSFYASGSPSGENVVVRDQVELLSAAGYDVQLFGRETDDARREPGYVGRAAVRVASGAGSSPLRALQAFLPDVVHVHNTFPNMGTNWLNSWNGPIVATLHNYRTVCANGLLFRDGAPCTKCLKLPILPALRHRCYRSSVTATLPVALGSSPRGGLRRVPHSAKKILCLNSRAAELFADLFGSHRVSVVPNFVNFESALPTDTSSTWVYVGRLSQEKGIGQLLRNWPSSWKLDLIGDGPMRGAIERHAAEHPSIRYLGEMPRESVLKNLAGYTGLVLPTLLPEGLPTVLLEATAAGLPVLVSERADVAADFVAAGAGRLFDPTADSVAYAQELQAISAERRTMSLAARRLYWTAYSPAAWLTSINQVYEDACVLGIDLI